MGHKAYKFTTVVSEDGKVEVKVPLPKGTRLEVVVLAAEEDEFADLLEAASRTMDFWNNPDDDAAWNQA